jgi:hypothetical protein
MKFRLFIVAALLLGMSSVVSVHQAGAAATITPEKIARIRSRCVENQAALNRLHQTDAFLRNDRGNLYRTISDKLMVPLNRRLASNQLDGGALLTITADYNSQYNKFYDQYIEYDNSLSKVLGIDCTREPVAFYNALLDAREKRIELSKTNQSIKDLVRQYGTAFTDFKTAYEKDHS